MSRRRRGALLAGLALLLGGLAASDVAGREAALRRELGPLVDVVVAREPLAAGSRLTAARLGVRRVPARFAPRGGFASAEALDGLRVRAAVPAGTDVTGGMRHRLETALELAGLGIPSLLANGLTPGLLSAALRGEEVTGTEVI